MAKVVRREAKALQERSQLTRAALLEGAGAVFATTSFAAARLQDIADAAGVSQGSLYFHFGNKVDIAAAVLELQQERMTGVLTEVMSGTGSGLVKLLAVTEGLAELVASDTIVQAGIRLSQQPGTGLDPVSGAPYFEWIRIARALIGEGVGDGSIDPNTDVDGAAALVNSIFVGAQVISGLRDSWQSLPQQMRQMQPHISALLSSARR